MNEIVYNLLAHYGTMTTKELAPHLGLDLHLTKKYLQRLERSGEIRMVSDNEETFFDQVWEL